VGEVEKYRDFIKRFPCDVMINECSQCGTTDVILDLIGDLKCKKIFHSHGFSGLKFNFIDVSNGMRYFLGSMYNFIRFRIFYFHFHKYAKRYNEIISLSKSSSSNAYLEKFGLKNYLILDNAADDIFTYPDRSIVNTYKPKGDYLISVAYYMSMKNQKKMIEHFYNLKSVKELSLVMIGESETPYLKELKKYKLKLDKEKGERKVIFHTGIHRELIPSFIEGAKLYLVTSKQEEYSVSLIEAMMLGVPFVSTNVGNAKDLPGGITVEENEDFSKKIEMLLSDNKLYEELSSKGKEFARERCTKDKAVEKIESIIKEVCL
jgi:glycosyltransferase involved in cell wall biosynthesis